MRAFSEIYLTGPQQQIIETLGRLQAMTQLPQTPRFIADSLGRVNKGEISKVLNQLAEKKVVENLHSQIKGGRHFVVSEWQLTDLGWHLYKQIKDNE